MNLQTEKNTYGEINIAFAQTQSLQTSMNYTVRAGSQKLRPCLWVLRFHGQLHRYALIHHKKPKNQAERPNLKSN